jgi:hypothetical protein
MRLNSRNTRARDGEVERIENAHRNNFVSDAEDP